MDTVGRTREQDLAGEIRDTWGVQDSLLVVEEYGTSKVAGVHRRLLWRQAEGLLERVRNLEGYFMASLRNRANGHIPGSAGLGWDEYATLYEQELAARGNPTTAEMARRAGFSNEEIAAMLPEDDPI